jgi:hypothetical protein
MIRSITGSPRFESMIGALHPAKPQRNAARMDHGQNEPADEGLNLTLIISRDCAWKPA